MSILNCHVRNDRALVMVDTKAGIFNGPQGYVSKLLPLPHAQCILAARGEVLFTGMVHLALNCSLNAGFDAIAQRIGEVLTQTYAARATQALPFAGVELALVGWSQTLGRMQGVRHERWPGDNGFRTTAIQPWSLSPSPGYMPEHEPDTAERMEAIARDQVRALLEVPTAIAGGDLVLAELTRDSLLVTRRVAG